MNEIPELIAENLSLYQLLKRFDKLEIPLIQRDYAHGRIERENEKYDTNELDNVKLIREGLVEAMFHSVASNKPLLLNFIYGKSVTKDSKQVFIPIDGQQRLTTMYLFHWYIFNYTKYSDGINELKKFSYETRATSRSFCEYLCDSSNSFNFNLPLAEQIMDCSWFSGNYNNDPTIKSMITVLATIQEKIGAYPDFETLRDRLINNCPIEFLWLDMKNIGNEDDLYIKMNARGKQLSDFEVFKASFESSDLLSAVIDSDDLTQKVSFVSKFNNQYANLFYAYLDKYADDGLMNLLKVILRDNYLVLASKNGISQQAYRDTYKLITEMNGKMFFRFAEQEDYYQFYKDKTPSFEYKFSQRDSLRMADNVLAKLHSFKEKYKDITISQPVSFLQKYYDEKDILIEYLKPNSETGMKTDLAQYSLFSFINRFNMPESDEEVLAFYMWKRFISNISKNVDIRTYETLVETMRIMLDVLDSINAFNESEVLSAISSVKDNPALTGKKFLRPQFFEESLKAQLMLNDFKWKQVILESEVYFEKGDIGFVLEFSKNESSEYDIRKFEEYNNLLKTIITPKKTLKDTKLINLFEKALLCQNDNSNNKMGHLTKLENSGAYSFCVRGFEKLLGNDYEIDDQRIRWLIFKALIDELDLSDLKASLIANITKNRSALNGWKRMFVDEDLFNIDMDNNCQFSNCIYITKDNTVLLLTKGSERSRSGELYAVRLYRDLSPIYDVNLHLEATGEAFDINGNPRRYIEYKSFRIGYNSKDSYYVYWNINDPTPTVLADENSVKSFIESL